MPSNPGIGMHVEVTDPNAQIVMSRVYSDKGKFAFTSYDPGEHVIGEGFTHPRRAERERYCEQQLAELAATQGNDAADHYRRRS